MPSGPRVSVALPHRATGNRSSTTVTMASHVSVRPAPSVTVRVTVLAPRSPHAKTVCEAVKARLPCPELLTEPPSRSCGLIVARPVTSRAASIFWHRAVGGSPLPSMITSVTAAPKIWPLPDSRQRGRPSKVAGNSGSSGRFNV